jgi:type I restriction enzyme M protein
MKDPKNLAETTWQIIWHARKAEPKECLLTFVELFLLKFLSDNLPKSTLPEAYRFYFLLEDPASFLAKHGMTAIEYYVKRIRPKFQELFPANLAASDSALSSMFGLMDVKSPTSIIDHFAFYRSDETVAGYNRTFLEILEAFNKFGPLTAIDPEFKLRLYETFLRRSARQQKIGQFFTPRNVVRPMIKMAQLNRLPDGATVLDPAAGVGGFVLEPLLFNDALPGNLRFEAGKPIRRVRTVGLDVDAHLHMLAKANMLVRVRPRPHRILPAKS